jgi:hypothetical protein
VRLGASRALRLLGGCRKGDCNANPFDLKVSVERCWRPFRF